MKNLFLACPVFTIGEGFIFTCFLDRFHAQRFSLLYITYLIDGLYHTRTYAHPPPAIPYEEFEGNPHTLLITTTSGGHIGFIEGIRPTKATWINRVCGELLEALKNYEH